MKLYIANKNYSSWSLRPWVLMRTLGMSFEEELRPFPMGGGASGFDAFSPSGKVPCLHDGQQVVWDSLAIAEYLAEQQAAVWPADASARAWARCAAAEMHSGFSTLRNICSMNCGLRVALDATSLQALAADLQRLQTLWSQGLERFGGPFLGGSSFTAVDAFFCPVAFRVQTFALPLSEACGVYVRTLLDLPAMKDWYASALQEPWLEPVHDAHTLAHGQLLADLRRP
jgi:glutathione S-transferase